MWLEGNPAALQLCALYQHDTQLSGRRFGMSHLSALRSRPQIMKPLVSDGETLHVQQSTTAAIAVMA